MRFQAALLTLVLMLPLASGEGPPAILQANVAGASLGGSVTVDGSLSAFHSTGDPDVPVSLPLPLGPPQPAPASRLPPAQLRLSARTLHLETDVETAMGSPYAGAPDRHTEPPLDVTDVHLATRAVRQGFLFFVAPLPGRPLPTVHAQAISANLAPTDAVAKEPARRVPTDRPSLEAGALPGVAIGNDGLRDVRIEGDFAITLWEWDVSISSGGDVVTATSGYQYQPVVPSAGGYDTVGRYEERQIFLEVHGATLDAIMPVGSATGLELRPVSGAVDGRITLETPQGTVTTADGVRTLRDGDWLEGRFVTEFSGLQAGSFLLDVKGNPTAASVDGRPASFGSAPSGFPILPTATVALVVVAAAAAAAWSLHRRTLRQLATAKLAMEAGDYEGVIAATKPRMLRLRRYAAAVRTQLAVAQLLTDRSEAAAQTLEGWRGSDATRDYLWACVHAARGEATKAAASLKACMDRDPVLAKQLIGDSLLSNMVRPDPRSEGYT
ncbi:MAG: hypothetical protein V4510_09290 [bacterium]